MKGIIITHVGKTIFIVISLIGFLLLIITLGLIIHEIVINAHNGFFGLSDSTRSFLERALIISAITVFTGFVGLLKCNEKIEKRAKILRRILELE